MPGRGADLGPAATLLAWVSAIQGPTTAVSPGLTLEQAGYVEIRKGFVGKRPRTSARLTPAGRTAFEQHVMALQEMVARSGITIVPR